VGRFAHPEVLVDPEWLADHLDDPRVRVIDIHLESGSYEEGHIPGAVFWPARTTLVGPDYRTNFDVAAVGDLLGRSGISNDTTVVAYSDLRSLGPWVFWFLKTMGHADVRVLDGGRSRWIADGHPLTTVVPDVAEVDYVAQAPERSRQADLDRVLAAVDDDRIVLLDVRTAEEWRGENFMLAPPQPGERGGHIPGAVHLYYEEALNPDGTFKSVEELTALFAAHGVTVDKETITYCAVGMRSAHTWFVLSQLLGWRHVTSYDGSWNQWGRLPYTPVQT
jgi:thiosulfate/3-mercaptopyruvate sulfurtransferase